MITIEPGDSVICIDNSSRPEWAEWYGDSQYCEDMLVRGGRYTVIDVAKRDDQIGVNVGVPTPWGDPFWNANRFQKSLLRQATRAPAYAEGKS